MRSWISELGSQPVGNRYDTTAAFVTEASAKTIMGIEVTHDPAAPVIENHQRAVGCPVVHPQLYWDTFDVDAEIADCHV